MTDLKQLKADYDTLGMLVFLVGLQDRNDHQLFADSMCYLWETVAATLPASSPMLVIDAYFKRHGNLREALREHSAAVEKRAGSAAHRAEMDRIRAQLATLDGVLKSV